MVVRIPSHRTRVVHWVHAVPFIFLLIGLSFGTWLSRLPTLRDHLGATPAPMGLYGLCLASGSVLALVVSGRIIQHFGPRRVLLICGISATITLPTAAILLLSVSIPAGLAVLLLFGFSFSMSDVAISVSGANAEAAFGRPRMPLMHAGYSLGAVAATGLGALAEAFSVPIPVHFAAVMLTSIIVLLFLMRFLPVDELGMRLAANADGDPAQDVPEAASQDHAATSSDSVLTVTGSIPVITHTQPVPDSAHTGALPVFTHTGAVPIIDEPGTGPGSGADAPAGTAGSPGAGRAASSSPRSTSPWRDPRLIAVGIITLSFGIFEGTAADWLPLALVDGRDLGNDLSTVMLSVFFCSALITRVVGSWLLERFGRVIVLRASAVLAAVGVVLLILVPGTPAAICGVIAWGIGGALGWPITMSAAADDPDRAARSVAAVAAIGYGSMLVGPLAFGLLGDHFGLLTAFWALVPFAVYVVFAAGAARVRARR